MIDPECPQHGGSGAGCADLSLQDCTCKPDFDELRRVRNEAIVAHVTQMAAELGATYEEVKHNFDPNACYCACTTGGPCEHVWDGPEYHSESFSSATCSRCGTMAMSHDLRVMP